MKQSQFDDMARALTGAAVRRRSVFRGLAAVVVGAAFVGADDAWSRRRRRQRKRRRSIICFKGQELAVRGAAARELLERGGQRGRCRQPGEPEEPGEPQTCAGAKPFCDVNPNPCGPAQSGCACLVSTGGAAVCALDQSVCEVDESTCVVDQDCVVRYGAGFACVSTAGCSGLFCGGNRNACVPPCPG